MKYSYDPDFRDAIAKSWPESLDDTLAKNDWGWNPKCKDVKSLVEEVLNYIKVNYKMTSSY
jgi:threonine 3-dehydrogenase